MVRALRLFGVVLAAVAEAKECCWCDPATPDSAKEVTGSDGKTYSLVFSDEFNEKGRKFANGEDSKWTALNVGDTSNQGTAFYLPEQTSIATDTNVTEGPVTGLLILTENVSHTGDSPTGEKNVHMPFRSAMLQTWNKVRGGPSASSPTPTRPHLVRVPHGGGPQFRRARPAD